MKKPWLLVLVLVMTGGLCAELYITLPQAALSYSAGLNLPIRWGTAPAGIPPASTRVSVWLRTQTALVQIGNNVSVGSGSMNWMIPRTVFGDKMRVSMIRQGTTEVLCTTPGYFYIIPPTRVQVLAPNGGETFRPGSTITVRWQATDIVSEHHQFAGVFLTYYPGGCRVGAPVYVAWASPTPHPAIDSGGTGCRLTIPASAPRNALYVVQVIVQSQEYIIRGFNKGNYDESDRCFTVAR